MKKNIKIAYRLIKIARSLIAAYGNYGKDDGVPIKLHPDTQKMVEWIKDIIRESDSYSFDKIIKVFKDGQKNLNTREILNEFPKKEANDTISFIILLQDLVSDYKFNRQGMDIDTLVKTIKGCYGNLPNEITQLIKKYKN